MRLHVGPGEGGQASKVVDALQASRIKAHRSKARAVVGRLLLGELAEPLQLLELEGADAVDVPPLRVLEKGRRPSERAAQQVLRRRQRQDRADDAFQSLGEGAPGVLAGER